MQAFGLGGGPFVPGVARSGDGDREGLAAAETVEIRHAVFGAGGRCDHRSVVQRVPQGGDCLFDHIRAERAEIHIQARIGAGGSDRGVRISVAVVVCEGRLLIVVAQGRDDLGLMAVAVFAAPEPFAGLGAGGVDFIEQFPVGVAAFLARLVVKGGACGGRQQGGKQHRHQQDAQQSSCSFHGFLLLRLLPRPRVSFLIKQQKQRGAPLSSGASAPCNRPFSVRKGLWPSTDSVRPGAPFFILVCKTGSVSSVAQASRFEQRLTGSNFPRGDLRASRGLSGARKRRSSVSHSFSLSLSSLLQQRFLSTRS